ncbi:hypothetical protein [Okeania sp.]|uniref:hypothetical protein n=1 Tax=Okeania sp. TaxID=3100323 RepID=UPI002B4B6021|nr:hypothetical protein [Okeania sp.]MEB3339412.1 hypothetical protein [Okeania sp.]
MTTEIPTHNVSYCLIYPAIYENNLPQHYPLKLGILASGNGSNFEVIAEAINNQKLNAQIQLMIYNNFKEGRKERKIQMP